MTRLLILLLGFAVFGLSGCVVYLDDPPKRKISGLVVRDDTGVPVANARVWFRSGRKPFSLLPVDTFGIDAGGTTDQEGKLSVTAKLNDKVEVIIQNEVFFQKFELPPFTSSNDAVGIVWRLKEKKPNQAPEPTAPSGRGSS